MHTNNVEINQCGECESTRVEWFKRTNNEGGIRCLSCGHEKITTRSSNYGDVPVQGAYTMTDTTQPKRF